MRSAVMAVVVLTGLTRLAGCSDDDKPEAAEASGPRQLEIADRFVHAGEPDFLLDAFGSIWSQTASGNPLRLEAESGELLDTHDTGYHAMPACNGNGFDETALWVCSGPEHLARIDPETGAAKPVAARKRADQTRFPFAGGLLWYLELDTTDLVGLDQAGSVGARVPLGSVCTTTASEGETVWVLCPTDGRLVEVDPGRTAVVGSIEVDNPRQAAIAGDLFVGSGPRGP